MVQDQINKTFLTRNPEENNGQKEPKVSIIFLKVHPSDDSKYVFKVLPGERQIVRSLSDLYWLRANLCIEFPFYYVLLLDTADQRRRLQGKFHPQLFLETDGHEDITGIRSTARVCGRRKN